MAAAALGAALLSSSGPGALAQNAAPLPRLYTNQEYIEDVSREAELDVTDVKSVFAYVLAHLPARVPVYPTENYYYFYFYHGGIRYAGNLRFEVEARDKGLVEFIYFKDTTEWQEDATDHFAQLGPADDVLVEKVADLSYRVAYAGTTVTFDLNDLSKVQPPPAMMTATEQFIGPVFDESGIRFFLLFDREMKAFRYILDETAPVSDELVATGGMDHIAIGRRTGFAFFRDPARTRQILVGVYGPNVDVNNNLDGPFDQLPDNFLKGDELRQALLASRPYLDKSIDRFGASPGGEFRESIDPYLAYLAEEDLAPAERCAAEAEQASLYRCLDALSSR